MHHLIRVGFISKLGSCDAIQSKLSFSYTSWQYLNNTPIQNLTRPINLLFIYDYNFLIQTLSNIYL